MSESPQSRRHAHGKSGKSSSGGGGSSSSVSSTSSTPTVTTTSAAPAVSVTTSAGAMAATSSGELSPSPSSRSPTASPPRKDSTGSVSPPRGVAVSRTTSPTATAGSPTASPPLSPTTSPSTSPPMNRPVSATFSEAVQLLNFLEDSTIARLLPKRDIVVADKNATVEETLELLSKNSILSVPIYDHEAQKYLGMFDLGDLVHLLLSDKADDIATQPIRKFINFSTVDVLYPMASDVSMYHLVEVFTRGIHRIPVMDAESQRIVNIVSQSSVVKYVAENIEKMRRAGAKTMDDLRLARKEVISMKASESAADGYKLIDAHKVDAIAILDADGKVVGCLSESHLRSRNLASLRQQLSQNVMEFIGNQKEGDFQTCHTSSRVKAVITQIAKTGAHQLWVVDDDNKPLGIVSLTDVMKALLLVQNSTAADKNKRRSIEAGRLGLFKR